MRYHLEFVLPLKSNYSFQGKRGCIPESKYSSFEKTLSQHVVRVRFKITF